MGLREYILVCLLCSIVSLNGQTIYSGRVIDLSTRKPLAGALIQFTNKSNSTLTNSVGEFRIISGKGEFPRDAIKIIGNTICWSLPSSAVLRIYNLSGQEIAPRYDLNIGEGQITLDNLNPEIYILKADLANGDAYHLKYLNVYNYYENIVYFQEFTKLVSLKSSVDTDTLVVSKDGYYPGEYILDKAYSEFELMYASYPSSIDYLNKLPCIEAFELLESKPFSPVLSEIKSIKIVYSIPENKMYFANSAKYTGHYSFAQNCLNYAKGSSDFNREQYTNNPNRIYYMAYLNHYSASDIYTLEFFAGNEFDCSQIETFYNKLIETTYIGAKLKFHANNLQWEKCTGIPIISTAELYAGQNYQPLNIEEAYGYLKKFTPEDLKTEYAGRHDIVILDEIPNDISVVAGIITTDFQTPLSHINVLSHNRGAPNMALRDGWTNPQLEALTNQLVYLKVTLDTFELRKASLTDAQAFWAKKEPSKITVLRHDIHTQGIFELSLANVYADTVIGGKAANFAELMKIKMNGNNSLPLPEDAFAIPFYYYWQHMHTNSLDSFVNIMLAEPRFQTDFLYRKTKLIQLQDSIKSCAIDPSLIALIAEKIPENGTFKNYRFRSSTNSEDIKGFNGAGLYDSYTGIPGDTKKTIELAIKKVWASVWNLAAFEEREYFKIDQQSVAMAVLVHRSFSDELANGVVITENPYNNYNPGILINVQAGEISITNPEGGYTSDQIIVYNYNEVIEYINHSNAPGMENKTVMSDAEILELDNYCKAIHNHYCMLNLECLTMDIEFKIDRINEERKIYIKQARIY